MPRIGFTPEEQSSGGLFRFEEGNGEIVDCKVINHAIPGYSADCGYLISIQRLDANWKPTGDEPIDEFLKAGPVEKDGDPRFHPGKAASSDDANPELEIGGKLDCGGEEDAEGTCLLTATGKGPDRKSKLSIFGRSLIEHGVKPNLLNGYAPNLIGLKAHFTQFMMEKIPGSTARNDPTCLIVGANGQVAGGKIVQYPNAQKGAPAAGKSGSGGTAAGPVAGKSAAKVGAPAGAAKVNGAAKPEPESVAGDVDEAVEAVAVDLLVKAAKAAAGQTLTPQKIQSRFLTLFAKNGVPVDQQKHIQALLKNAEWFGQKCAEMEWPVLETGEVQFPAAE